MGHALYPNFLAIQQVADALEMPFNDNSFDLVWSLESGEHMPDKSRFVNELARVAAPEDESLSSRGAIATWKRAKHL